MALITSAATGNFNAGATWAGGVVPGVGDEARASTGHTITITANATCDEVSNAGTGKFVLNSGVTLTANVTHKGTTNSTNCLEYSGTGSAGKIIGNITGGAAFFRTGAANTGIGTLEIQGNVTGGVDTPGVNNASTGIIILTGNITGNTTNTSVNGSGVNNAAGGSVTVTGNATGSFASAVNNNAGGSVIITGNVTGGSAANSAGIRNASTGSCTITGLSTGGINATAAGIINVSTGTVTLNGSSVGGSSLTAGPGCINSSTGTISITRAAGNGFGPGSTGLSSAVGASNTGLGIIEIEQLEFGTYGQSPVSGTGMRLKKVSTNAAVFYYCNTAGAKTLIDATQANQPAAADVRSGVSYASGARVGTCAVPPAGSVALGVAVDATTGTAALTPEAVWNYNARTITGGTVNTLTNAPASVTPSDIWSHSTRTLTSASGPTAAENASAVWAAGSRTITGGTVDTLTNAPTVPSASAIASQVRTELGTELADIAAIKAVTDDLDPITERLANVATTNIVGTLLAQANS